MKFLYLLLITAFCTYTATAQCSSNIYLDNQAEVNAFPSNYGCSFLQGNLIIGTTSTSDISDLSPLSGISFITGDMTIRYTSLTDLSGIETLETVGGAFRIEQNASLTSLTGLEGFGITYGNLNILGNTALTDLSSLDALTYVGNNFLIQGNNALQTISGLENVSNVSGTLNISTNPALTSLGDFASLTELGSLTIAENDNLSNLSGLELDAIENHLWIRENDVLISLAGLESLNSLGGSLTIEDNPVLLNLEGLNSLTSVYNVNIQSNPSLNSLTGLANIVSVGGQLRIYDNDALTSLAGLESITSAGDLFVEENQSLPNLTGLESLESLGYYLSIKFNDNMTSLTGLNNLTDLPSYLYVQDNPLLGDCCSILSYLDDITSSWGTPININNNAPTCSSVEDIASHCSQAEFQAAAYFDENQNGIWDGTEQLLNQSFTLEPSSVVAYSDESTNYAQYYVNDYGTYSLHLNENYLWTFNGVADSIEIVFEDADLDGSEFYFPMVPINNYVVHNIDLSSSITRCSRSTTYWVTYANTGTVVTDGFVYLVPDNLTTFESAVPAPDATNGDTLFWYFNDLYPSYSEQIQLIFEMPSFEAIGETIDFEAFISTYGDTGTDKAILSSDLVCAYDPNDKLAMPPGVQEENYTLFGDTMAYTVRFQNTGNDTAFTVVIQDTLSTHLDLNTFRPIASSHAVQTTLDLATRIATFTFNDIYLPDSFVNEPGSHGLVKFEIETIENIAENTLIENNAGIYFDFNPAVVTNTVHNTFVSEIPTEGLEMQMKVYLEGTYDNGLMGAGLTPVVPLSQPYYTAPWHYLGNETLSEVPVDMVDWVLVEARIGTPNLSGTPGTATIETVAGILTTDGTIIAANGGPVRFSNLEEGNQYYFSIRHRNHLDIMTAVSVVATEGMQYDFTTSIDQAFGFQQQKFGNDGKAVMASGDINADGLIQTTDYDIWFENKATVNTYHPADLNLDNVIQTTDFDWWFFNKAKVGLAELQY